MANSGARPNSESSSFPCKRLPRYSEASSWPDYARCLARKSCICPIRSSRHLPPALAGCRSSIQSAGSFMPNVPLGGRSRSYDRAPAALENRSGCFDITLPAIVAKDSIMADAHESRREDMQAETPDELQGAEG